MRILLLGDSAAPHTRRWAVWFSRRGHEVHVVSLNRQTLGGYAPSVVHTLWQPRFGNSLPERLVKTPIVLGRLRALVRRLPPDVVHAHSAGGYAWTALLGGFRPYIVTPWGTDLLVDVQRSRLNRWFTGLALRKAALVTTDGLHFVDVIRRLGVPEDRILVHAFGTDVSRFRPGPDAGERERLGVGAAPLVVSTRTLYPVHDVETFVRAMPLIREAHPSTRFVVAGDGTERARLEAMVASLGLEAAASFVGMVEEEQMQRLLRAADVYVSSSRMDAGLAASTAEAMATCLPVVQTDNSDNAHWTPAGEGGFLFPNGDPAALAASVSRLLSDGQARRTMGARNRRAVVVHCNLDTEMSRIEVQYFRIVQEAAVRKHRH